MLETHKTADTKKFVTNTLEMATFIHVGTSVFVYAHTNTRIHPEILTQKQVTIITLKTKWSED